MGCTTYKVTDPFKVPFWGTCLVRTFCRKHKVPAHLTRMLLGHQMAGGEIYVKSDGVFNNDWQLCVSLKTPEYDKWGRRETCRHSLLLRLHQDTPDTLDLLSGTFETGIAL